MNLWVIIPTLIAIVGVTVGIINAIGKDHEAKRNMLTRVGVIGAVFILVVLSGVMIWQLFSGRHHDANLDADSDAGNKAQKAQANNTKIAHREAPIPAVKPAKYLKNPTPVHIYKTLKNTPPLSREAAAEQFIGAPVDWEGSMYDSNSFSGKRSIVLATTDPETKGLGVRPPNFRVQIELPRDRVFLQAKVGAKIRVEGIIERISDDGFFIVLKDATAQLVEE